MSLYELLVVFGPGLTLKITGMTFVSCNPVRNMSLFSINSRMSHSPANIFHLCSDILRRLL